MTIRASTEADVPRIIELLKSSLGETLMPKSEAFWRWKHWENPFGKSPVLLAFENETLIGVRAFMKWEWRYDNKIIKYLPTGADLKLYNSGEATAEMKTALAEANKAAGPEILNTTLIIPIVLILAFAGLFIYMRNKKKG